SETNEQGTKRDMGPQGAGAKKNPKTEAEAGPAANEAAKAKGKDHADPADIEAAKAKAREDMKAFEDKVAKGDPEALAVKAAHDEKEKILNDKDYQDKTLGFLSDDERAVALNALKQGGMRPEDELRGAMLGAGTDEDKIKEVLGKLSPEEKETVKAEYARKYGTDLTSDLHDELSGQDLTDVDRLLAR